MLMKEKNKYPFRLGCTSYVYPDDILPNVEKMASFVDDIEIVLFESEKYSNLPGSDIINELGRYAEHYSITYTVHFPIDFDAGSTDKQERNQFINTIKKIAELTQPINPYGYILHLQGIQSISSKKQVETWYSACNDVCRNIAKIADLDCAKICVENLDYPMEWYMDLVSKYGFSLCCDMGHLWLYTKNWDELLQKNISKTRVIHLHGVCNMKDHISLKKGKVEDVGRCVEILKDFQYKQVVSLEVFNQEDTFGSIDMVEELWQK